MKQTYGNEKDWKGHFNYLLPFFKDERYIKIENKPVFVIYKIEDIENSEEMLKIWNEEAKKNGLDEVYIIESVDYYKKNKFSTMSNALVYREPSIALSKIRKKSKLDKIKEKFFPTKKGLPEKIDGNLVWKYILENIKNNNKSKKIFYGSFSSWDNTPRHGERGFIIENCNPENFKKYFEQQLELIKQNKVEYLFFNAWNEWDEGMYLEPDEENKYGYLEVIRDVFKK